MIKVIANFGVNLLGLLIFLFIFWKKMKEDYVSEIIFSVAFVMLGIAFAGGVVAWRFLPDWFFWLETLGIIIGLITSYYKYKVRFYETLEALVIAILPWLSIFYLYDSAKNSSLISLIFFFLTLGFILLFYFFDLKYKNFTWYRSGRVGFSGVATLGVFFLVRCSVSVFGIGVLSFVGKFEPYLSGIMAFITFILIYNLGKGYE